MSHPKVPRALSGGSAGASTVAGGSSSTGVRPVGCKTVFVKNLPYEVTEEQIQQTFMVCGPIAMVRLATWGHTGSQKGFCYVDFKREDSAEIAGNFLIYSYIRIHIHTHLPIHITIYISIYIHTYISSNNHHFFH